MHTAAMVMGLCAGFTLDRGLARAANGPADPVASAVLGEGTIASAPSSDFGFGVVEAPTTYLALGTKIYARHALTGAAVWTSPSFPQTLQAGVQPVPLSSGKLAVFVAQGSHVIRFSADKGTSDWNTDLARMSASGPTCLTDEIFGTPSVMLRSYANSAYQASGLGDLVLVGTRYGCGTTTLNRFYALDADTGSVVWVFNATGQWQVGFSSRGPAIDYDRNLAYFGTDIPSPTSYQNSLWAISLTTGARLWSTNTGNAVRTIPRLGNGVLYSFGYQGKITAHDPNTGALIRSVTLMTTTGLPTTIANDPWAESRAGGFAGWILARTGDGNLHGVRDTWTGFQDMWRTGFGATVTTMPVLDAKTGSGYVGLTNGKLIQFAVINGIQQAQTTVSLGQTVFEPGATIESPAPEVGVEFLSVVSAGTWRRYQVPWPNGASGSTGRIGDGAPAPLGMGTYCSADQDCRWGTDFCLTPRCVNGYCIDDTTTQEGLSCDGPLGVCDRGVCHGGACESQDTSACGCQEPNQPGACGTGKTCCGASVGCVDLVNSALHCGGCGNACADGQQCVDGGCVSAQCTVPLVDEVLDGLRGSTDLAFDQLNDVCHLYTSFWEGSKGGIFHVQSDGKTIDRWDNPAGLGSLGLDVTKDGELAFATSPLAAGPSLHWHDQPGKLDDFVGLSSGGSRDPRPAIDTKVYTGSSSTDARVYVSNDNFPSQIDYYDLQLISGVWKITSGPNALVKSPDDLEIVDIAYSINKETGDGQIIYTTGDLDRDGNRPTLRGYCDTTTNGGVACVRGSFAITTEDQVLADARAIVSISAHRVYGDLAIIVRQPGDVFTPMNVRIDDLTVRLAQDAQLDFNLAITAKTAGRWRTAAYAGSTLWELESDKPDAPDGAVSFFAHPQRP